jgi:hypothetical protein
MPFMAGFIIRRATVRNDRRRRRQQAWQNIAARLHFGSKANADRE